MRFGIILARLRKKKGWSQDGLSRKLGLSPCPLRSWEKGRRLPTEDNFLKIIDILGKNESLTEAYYIARNSRRGSHTSALRNDDGESFGSRLRQLMVGQELSVSSLAACLETETGIVRKWLRDRSIPNPDNFQKLTERLGKDEALTDLYKAVLKFQHSWAVLRNNQKMRKKRFYPGSALGDLLKSRRLEQQKTQADLAQELGVSGSAVSLWEVSGVLPVPDKFTKLSEILDLPQDAGREYASIRRIRYKGGKQ